METPGNLYPNIDPPLWATVERWFHYIADLPEEEQLRELDGLKEAEPKVFQCLTMLLAEDRNPYPLLSLSADDILTRWHNDHELVGTSIGAFRLKTHIGQGAMGTVFLAERNDGQFDQTVALKLMRPVIHDDALQRFFREERQILAGLNHPNIARLFDGGFSDNGRPYFTMEYISGKSLTDYCAPLPLEKRLEIFLQVCDAVSHAHRSLIVHLDLKPKNIIADEEGKVKLLDFGVARLLKHEEPNLRPANRFTLAYASPEQLENQPVSTSSDLYALGTILYELVAGVHPFHRHFKSIAALSEAVLVEDPPRLKKNPADLDAICQKALKKKAAERYESVADLSRDLRAHLSGYPVKARKRTPGYVASKFLSRNRALVAAATSALVLLTVTVLYYTNRLARERDVAVMEATRSAEIVKLLKDVFTAADPNTGSGDTLTAVQLLDQGLDKLQGNLENQPELLASMLVQISPIYLNLGKYEKADSLARLAMTLHEDLFEPPDRNLAANLVLLGQVMINNGDVDSAETFITQALDQYHQLKMDDALEMADALAEISTVFYLKGQYAGSDSVHRMVYDIHTKKLTPPHAEIANDLHMIGTTLRKMGEYEEAERHLLASLEMKRKLYREPHLEIAYALNHLGSLRQNTGDWRGSIPYVRESLRQRQAILGPVHIESIASESNLARAYSNLDLLDSAVFLYDDVLSKMRVIFPNGHYYVAAVMQSLGHAHLRDDNLPRAEALFRESIAMQQEQLPEDDVNRAFALIGLGRTLMKKGDYQDAKKPLREAFQLRSEYLTKDHELVGVSQQALGECSLATQDYPTAVVLLEGAYSSLQKYPDKYKEELNTILRDLAEACQKNDLPEKAAYYQTLLARL